MSIVTAREQLEKTRVTAALPHFVGPVGVGLGLLLGFIAVALPWVNAPAENFGIQETDTRLMVGLRQGLAGGDGWIAVALLTVALIAMLRIWRAGISWVSRLVLVTTSLLLMLWVGASAASLTEAWTPAWPMPALIVSGALIFCATFLIRQNPEARIRAEVHAALRVFDQGRRADGIALQQKLLQRELKRAGWSRDAGFLSLNLAYLHARTGAGEVAYQIMHQVHENCGEAFLPDDYESVALIHQEIVASLTAFAHTS